MGKNGVVKDKDIHKKVINKVIDYVKDMNLSALNLTYSPIKGPAGNIEYLLYISDKSDKKQDFNVGDIVNSAFDKLKPE